MKKIAFALLFSTVATGAMAADAVVYEEPAPVEVSFFSWTGGYVGLQGGYTNIDADLENNTELNLIASPNVDSLSLGGFAGYRYQFSSNIVAGIEADANWLSGSGSDVWFNTANLTNYPDSPELDPSWDASIRATLGYAMDRWLPYVTGGVAFLDYDINVFPVNYNGSLRTGGTETGWTVGLGAAYAFTDNLIGQVDYRYADFGNQHTIFGDGYSEDDDLQTHKFNFGIAYKF